MSVVIGRRVWGRGLAVWLLAAAVWLAGCPSDEVPVDDDDAGDDDSAADDDVTGDDDTVPAGPQWEIDVIGEEEVVGGVSGFRSLTIAVDSVGQPHVIAENYGAGLYAYHRLSGDWQGEEPWFAPGGDLGSVHLEIDHIDRGWVSFTSFIAYDTEATGEWVALVRDMSHAPTLFWAENIRSYTGFSGNLSIDPHFPDNAWRMGGQPHPTYRFDDQGGYVQDVTMSPGESGEGIRFRIAGNEGGGLPGVWHAATGIWNLGGNDGGYQNSVRMAAGEGPTPWCSYTYPQWGDSHYPSVGVDAVEPEVAYLAGSYEGLIINVWDGEQMMFPIDALHVVDADIAEYGNGIGRFTPIWAAARGGGAFLCWTGVDWQVRLAYVSPIGVEHFGEPVVVGPGSRCAIDVDDDGHIHMAYDNGGVRYRRVTTR